jgi:hypothetical protein
MGKTMKLVEKYQLKLNFQPHRWNYPLFSS